MNKNIIKIYSDYFDIIDSYFGCIKRHLQSDDGSHIILGEQIARYPLVSDLILDAIYDLNDEITAFWGKNTTTLVDFFKSQETLKCVYSGDVSPIVSVNFIKRSGMYVDTTILPDPLFNLTISQEHELWEEKYFLNKLIRHVFNIWKLKDVVLAGAKNQVVALLPINLFCVNESDRDRLKAKANKNFLNYMNQLINQDFSNIDSLIEHLEKIESCQAVYEQLTNTNLLPNKFQNYRFFEAFFSDFYNPKRNKMMQSKTIGWAFALYFNCQFLRVQEHIHFCNILRAEPIYDYDVPWYFLNLELGGMDMDAAISNALQKEEFQWMNNVPISILRVLREENQLEYMRAVMRKGITDLKAKNDTELLKTSEQLTQNFQEAFQRQNSELVELQKRTNNILHKELPIVGGGFLAGQIPYLGTAVSIICAGCDVKKLLAEKKRAEETKKALEHNVINLLMKAREEQ